MNASTQEALTARLAQYQKAECSTNVAEIVYWRKQYKQLAEDAIAALRQGAQPGNPWREAIDEALVVSCLDCLGEDETAEAALARLIHWEVEMALDPKISARAAALQDQGARPVEEVVYTCSIFPT